MTAPDIWRGIFAASVDGLLELDGQGQVVAANPTLLGWLNCDQSAVAGRCLGDLIDQAAAAERLGSASWSSIWRLRQRTGDRWVSVSVTPVAGDGEVAAVAVLRPMPEDGALVEEFRRKIDELDTTQLVAINTIAHLAEFHDPDIGFHLERVRLYTYTLANYLAETGQSGFISEDEIVQLSRCAILHDVGKSAIPVEVLRKPGPLRPYEWELVKTHAAFGKQFLERADAELQRLLGVPATFLAMATLIAHGHHEWYDGSGYPCGLAGAAIPLPARIVAVADVYDALTSRRVYKPAWAHTAAREQLIQERGTHFDPVVIEAFLAAEDAFCAIQESMQPATDPTSDQAR